MQKLLHTLGSLLRFLLSALPCVWAAEAIDCAWDTGSLESFSPSPSSPLWAAAVLPLLQAAAFSGARGWYTNRPLLAPVRGRGCSPGTGRRASGGTFCAADGSSRGSCALVLAEKGVGPRQPRMAVHSYLAGVLLVRVKAYFLPCSPADRSEVRVTTAFCHQSKMTARFPPALYVSCVAS